MRHHISLAAISPGSPKLWHLVLGLHSGHQLPNTTCLGAVLCYQDSGGQPTVLRPPLSMSSMLDCSTPARVAQYVMVCSP